MGAYVEQLECLNCSQSRSFVLHVDHAQRILGQRRGRPARAAGGAEGCGLVAEAYRFEIGGKLPFIG